MTFIKVEYPKIYIAYSKSTKARKNVKTNNTIHAIGVL